MQPETEVVIYDCFDKIKQKITLEHASHINVDSNAIISLLTKVDNYRNNILKSMKVLFTEKGENNAEHSGNQSN